MKRITLNSINSSLPVLSGWFWRKDFTGKDLMHRYGANGHVRKVKRMVTGPVK
jgi:hypothetical protein